ncbi:hypothetical protein GVX82_00615 [Patescibacteria group bacterium]|jgi:hypothetical protein|nr:hypothetical protein [Patescibacteria group bacterium]
MTYFEIVQNLIRRGTPAALTEARLVMRDFGHKPDEPALPLVVKLYLKAMNA